MSKDKNGVCGCQKNKKKIAKVGATKEKDNIWGWVLAAGVGFGVFFFVQQMKNGTKLPPPPPSSSPPLPPPPSGGPQSPPPQLPPPTTSLPYNPSNLQPYTELSNANTDTKKAVQYQLNNLFDYLREYGTPYQIWWESGMSSANIPANLVVDGQLGSLSQTAIKYLFSWSYNAINPQLTKKNPATSTINPLQLYQNGIGSMVHNVTNL